MKNQCHPRQGLRQNYSVIVSYLPVTDVIKDRKRKKLFFCLLVYLFSFSSLSKHIFEAVLNHGGDNVKVYV